MPGADAVDSSLGRGRLTATWVELTIRLGVLALLLYWSFVLVQPFITIAIWSAVVRSRSIRSMKSWLPCLAAAAGWPPLC